MANRPICDDRSVVQKFSEPKKIARIEFKAGIGSGNKLIDANNFTLFASNHQNCDRPIQAESLVKIDSLIIEDFKNQDERKR